MRERHDRRERIDAAMLQDRLVLADRLGVFALHEGLAAQIEGHEAGDGPEFGRRGVLQSR